MGEKIQILTKQEETDGIYGEAKKLIEVLEGYKDAADQAFIDSVEKTESGEKFSPHMNEVTAHEKMDYQTKILLLQDMLAKIDGYSHELAILNRGDDILRGQFDVLQKKAAPLLEQLQTIEKNLATEITRIKAGLETENLLKNLGKDEK